MIPETIFIAVLAPIGFVAIGAMLVLLGEVLLSRSKSFLGRPWNARLVGSVLAGVAMFSLLLAFFVSSQWFASGEAQVFNPQHPLLQFDRFSALASALIAVTALLCCALATYYLGAVGINHAEYYALLLLATAGMLTLVAAIDFLTLFVGLELMTVPIYALAGFDRRRLSSNESALKYFLIGSFASAILLYGVALLYGATGSTSFAALREGFDPQSPLALTGLGLVVVGFAFKISAVPFHQWTPDVYEGAPASVTAFMSVAVKAAGVFALLRLLALGASPGDGSGATPLVGIGAASLDHLLAGLAALTMIVGNLMMLIQDNVKRLLAYSSVAHAGYLLVGVAVGTAEAWAAVVFYLIAYSFMNLGAFAIVVALAQGRRDCERVASFAGLSRARPGLAALMTLFLLALAGIPPTAGFFAKFGLFSAAVGAGFVPLAIVGVLMSVVSVYAYLRIPVLMYMREPGEFAGPPAEAQSGERFVLFVCAVVVLALGVLPNGGTLLDFSLGGQAFVLRLPPVLDWARAAVAALIS